MSTNTPFESKNTSTMYWYVLCVTPGKEIKIAKVLKSMGIEIFCPISMENRNSGKQREVFSGPLFKSYIFVRISKRNRVAVFNVPGVSCYLFVEGRPAIIQDAEINTIRRWVADDSVYEIVITKYGPSSTFTVGNSLITDRPLAKTGIEKKNLKLFLKCLDLVLHAKAKEIVSNPKYYRYQSLN